MSAGSDPQSVVRAFPKTRDFFIGIDSDGCAFDTMEVKHKECFIPNIIRFYKLAAVSKMAREAAEFVNLYSQDRGINRFPGLIKALDLLARRPEVARRGFSVPKLPQVRDWCLRETKLANPTLEKLVEQTQDPELAACLDWSKGVNRSVDDIVHNVPPFPMVRESLLAIQGQADVMVVSATPCNALEREWAEHGLKGFTSLIAGQELGSKKELLALGAVGKYPLDNILMVGDAPGDLVAAQANGVRFYPIDPGHEDESWQRFHDEALPKFFEGTYKGAYESERIEKFLGLLPQQPPWQEIDS